MDGRRAEVGRENSKAASRGKTIIAVITSKLMHSHLRFRGEMQKQPRGRNEMCFSSSYRRSAEVIAGRFINVNHSCDRPLHDRTEYSIE